MPDHSNGFHIMTKPVGPICNLNCRYCFYLEKEHLYPEDAARSQWAMPDSVLESYIRQYSQSQDSAVLSFAWQGGEPTLLGVDYFRKVVALEKKYADGRRVQNVFQTNGILLDDAWGEFLAEHRILVGLSIDGPRELHDCYRVDKGGLPTFDRVMRGLGILKKHGVEFNTLTVIHRKNSYHPLDVYAFLKEAGSGYMQFIPLVERIAPEGVELLGPGASREGRVSDWSVEPLQYGKFLCAVFDEWADKDVGRYYVQTFEVSLESWLGVPPSLCVFRETCGSALALEHNGDLYSCDHYVYPEYRLGNIANQPLQELVNLPAQRQFGLDKRDALPRYCLECEVRFACNGECPKHRFLRTPSGEPGLNYLCAGYKLFFKHIDPVMRRLAAELRRRQLAANTPGRPPGRNDACSCGSGKKFKKCCMGRG